MKKLAAGILLTALLLVLATAALASTDYDALIMKDTGKTSKELCDSDSRSVTAALILLDYMLVSNKDADYLDRFNWNGTCRVGQWPASVDVYYPMSGGEYKNLFFLPYSGKITDYGEGTSQTGSSEYTYYYVSMSDVLNALSAAVEYLGN